MGLDAKGMVFGRYVLLERIAAGGMGEVYVGLQTGIGRFSRPIAVKLLLPHLADDPRLVSMFLQEARVGAQIVHANVAQVYDVGQEHGRYFIAMELVRGVALSKLVAGLKGSNEPLDAELIAYVGRSLCEGLHVAHEQKSPDGRPLQLVHRDVTPHNVLVGVDGAVKLTDFGIARVSEGDRLSRPGLVMGKLGYLAPEQMLGQPIDRRVDVFAAGATLYYLAALEKPFDTPTGSTLDPHRLPTAPLRVLRPDLPRSLVDAIETAMNPNLAARFQTARDFRNALPVPGPDAGEGLGAILKRVCAAALVELEHKTERATRHDLGAVDRAVETASARPSVKAREGAKPEERSAATPHPELVRPRRTGLLAAFAVATVALVAGLFFLFRTEPPTPPSLVAPVAAPTPPSAVNAVADLPPTPRPPLPEAMPDAGAPAGAAATPEAAGFGFLTLDATPWALVTLDGKALGETPLANVRVASGTHALVFKNPDTGRELRRKVAVAAGKTVPVRVDLR
ncbi:MAG: serine/threonine-protein kinase [Myxococcota bacterium]